jgi:predicted amidohydrolase
MENINISTTQFEHKSGDKNYNFSAINKLSKKATGEGSDIICFHKCSTGLAEFIPGEKAFQSLLELLLRITQLFWRDF